MARTVKDLITVSPPNLDRTGYLALEQAFSGNAEPLDRDWLLKRLEDGLQIRILRPPARGFIEFAPGRASWRAVDGADHAVVVQYLHAETDEDAAQLMAAAESWARYYDFEALLALAGPHPGLLAPGAIPDCGLTMMDETDQDMQLLGKILHGPMAMPSLPQNWRDRAGALGPGLVVQCVERWPDRVAKARDLVARAQAKGLAARLDLLTTPEDARARAASPVSTCSVVMNGARIEDARLSDLQIWRALQARASTSAR